MRLKEELLLDLGGDFGLSFLGTLQSLLRLALPGDVLRKAGVPMYLAVRAKDRKCSSSNPAKLA
jgi:hypothetical protein